MGAYVGGSANEEAVPDTYLLDLRIALRGEFAKITDPAQTARLMPMRMAIKMAFNDHVAAAVIYQMISQIDVSDDDFLNGIQAEMLSLPQWPVTS